MYNLEDSENNAKITDSAYSTSCNSQSRRSHSSFTHSGSNSSGSSGYGGKPSTSGSSNKIEQAIKKDKETKKKKQPQTEVMAVEELVVVECRGPEPTSLADVHKEKTNDVFETPSLPLAQPEKAVENMDVSTSDLTTKTNETSIETMQASTKVSLERSCQIANIDSDGFSCAVSMHDGVVMYTTQNLTTNLGFPKDMWIGRSFINFLHPRDRDTFASQITKALAVPKIDLDTQNNVKTPGISVSTMVCRIRQYRSLSTSFSVKDRTVTYLPFLLKLSFKDINDNDGKIVYLIIQVTRICSAFKTPNECLENASPFVIRHSAGGMLEYIDISSVPYLGYLPQDIQNQDALMLYHPDDLPYLKMIYENILKEGNVLDSLPFRMLTHNGDYVKLKTEWSSFINPWSMKLEFVIGKHRILEGPATPDVFLSPPSVNFMKIADDDSIKAEYALMYRENIARILKDVLTKPAEKAKQQMTKRCQDLAMIMESLLEDQPKKEEEVTVEIKKLDQNSYERDSVILGGISPHHSYNDSKSSTGTPLSYNQLNYNDNLQRFFDSHQNYCFEEKSTTPADGVNSVLEPKPSSSNYRMSLAQSSESAEADSSGSSSVTALHRCGPPASLRGLQPLRLTKTLLAKHNNKMEKELAMNHRDDRGNSKVERVLQTRQKRREHLARCNASFQPTMAGVNIWAEPHSLKRTSKTMRADGAHKQSRAARRRRQTTKAAASAQLSSTAPTSVADNPYTWRASTSSAQMNNMNAYVLDMQAKQMPMMSPHVSGAFPIYYSPTAMPAASHMTATPSTSKQRGHPHQHPHADQHSHAHQHSHADRHAHANHHPLAHVYQHAHRHPHQHQQAHAHQHAHAQPHSHAHQHAHAQQHSHAHQHSYAHQHSHAHQHAHAHRNVHPHAYPHAYQNLQAHDIAQPPHYPHAHQITQTMPHQLQHYSSAPMPWWYQQPVYESPYVYPQMTYNLQQQQAIMEQSIAYNQSANQSLKPLGLANSNYIQSTEPVPELSKDNQCAQDKTMSHSGQSGQNSDDAMDRTDGESSYSSFYSSFLKTDSGSADDSSDPKKARYELNNTSSSDAAPAYTYKPRKTLGKKTDPPWLEQVSVSSDLVYKYQIRPKTKEEALQSDMQMIQCLEQPAMVNEQLGQLYLDLQLEGVASRLTLEEGVTSSSSSGEETCYSVPKHKYFRRGREYSKLNLIYEEDADLPPPIEIKDISCGKPTLVNS